MTSTAERWLLRAILAYGVFIVYGSWVPLAWHAQPMGQAWSAFLALPGPSWPPESLTDAAVNTLLPMPLALALALRAALASQLARRALRLTLALLLLALLPLVAEFGQMFFDGRDPSWSDVSAQWAGALIALLLFFPFRKRIRHWLDQLVATHGVRDRALAWLGLYLLGLLAYELMPLDLSISPAEIYRKWRDGHVLLVPFAGLPGDGLALGVKLLGSVGAWVPVGLMWRWSRPQAPLSALVLRGAGFALGVEIAQLFVLSRVTSVTDVLLGAAGTACGVGLAAVLARVAALSLRQGQRLAMVLAAVWMLAAVTATWAPFDFDVHHGSAKAWLEAFTRMPLSTYFIRSELGALGDIVRKTVLYVPAGALLAWRWPRHATLGLVTLALVAFLLETGQVWLPDKTADLTDALLGVAGALLGWRVTRAVLHAPSIAPARPAAPMLPPKTGTAPPTPRSRPHPLAGWVGTVALLLALAAAAWMLARSPLVPYNVPKLLPRGPEGVWSALGLSFTLWWMLVAPMRLLRPGQGVALVLLPLTLLAHGLVAFTVLRLCVPLQMMLKLIGTPVLEWPWIWEDLLRFLALYMSVMVPVVGGMVLVRTVWQPTRIADLVSWGFVALLVAWPLHAVVVEAAGTDNLVELMRDGGSLLTSSVLATAVWMLATAGSALGLLMAQRRSRLTLGLLAALALASVPLLLQAGLEPMLVKYERAFSALQFILSASREQYAAPTELQARLGIALLGAVLLVAILQRPGWKRLATA